MNQLGRKDGLEWDKVRAMIRYIFRNTGIKISVCSKMEYTKEEKLIIFKQFHNSVLGGHAGINKTVRKIKRQFNWPGLKLDVKNYITNCESCQKNKVTNRKIKQPMVITTTSSKPFEKIFLDIVEPLVTTASGNTYILTMQDDLTKYSLGVPLPNHTANTVAEAFVVHFVCIHGIPETILTDQGTDFLKNTHKFVIMDFEFTNIHRTSKVLISGAISNTLDRFKIRKLEGRPLYLPENGEVRPMKDREVLVVQKALARIFKAKTELRDICLDQLNQSHRAPVNSLNATYIRNYILRDNKINVIVVFGGSSDKEMLKRLGIEFPLLDMRCYDKHLNRIFYLQLEDVSNKKLIFEIEIGYYDKSGRILNLTESHNLICKKKHKITYARRSSCI
ncbi:uncharacterized protein LOC132945602 [Metopolophium dirhodum]|uniref:uncharacterized protein LOC132945602 n=1 Tax=Metopolophium dirhodum TaxID=44670 RepID=UPI00298F7867|nr:uncharacterized protein LOC132945602 [Metopolophium dirhodum]